MKAKPNIENFLAGGAAAATEQPKPGKTPAPVSVISEQRRTKSIRISPSLDMFLKEEAFKRTMATGKRVNESDLIEEALSVHFRVVNR
jgi:hypothetical protein